jgi:hypothetical protein
MLGSPGGDIFVASWDGVGSATGNGVYHYIIIIIIIIIIYIYIYLMYTYDMVYFWFYRSILMAYARFIMIVWHSSDGCVCAGMFVVEVRVWLLDIWGARWQVHLGCCRGGSWLMLPMDRVSAQIWFAECCEALVAGAFLESRENSSRTIEYARRKARTNVSKALGAVQHVGRHAGFSKVRLGQNDRISPPALIVFSILKTTSLSWARCYRSHQFSDHLMWSKLQYSWGEGAIVPVDHGHSFEIAAGKEAVGHWIHPPQAADVWVSSTVRGHSPYPPV